MCNLKTGNGSRVPHSLHLTWTLGAGLLCAALASAGGAQGPLTSIPGSPFVFSQGSYTNMLALSPDQSLLFTTNQNSNNISVLNVGGDGSLSPQGAYSASPCTAASGLSLSPAGDRLYVISGNADELTVYSVAPDGTLAQIQAVSPGDSAAPLNGIQYVSVPGGDFIYVANNSSPNTVRSYSVNPNGTLTAGAVVATGGSGAGFGGAYAPPRLVAGPDNRLYVDNEGSNNISVFKIADDGTLGAVGGSPFTLPNGVSSSGSIALSPDASSLYAGTNDGRVVQYSIDPGTGALSLLQIGSTTVADAVSGLVVDPTGAYVVAVLRYSNKLSVLDTSTMTNVTGSPESSDDSGASAAGVIFSFDGTLVFTANRGGNSDVSVYTFSP